VARATVSPADPVHGVGMGNDRWIDRKIDELLVEHNGAFARREAVRKGVPERALNRRIQSGALGVVHRGVLTRPGTPDTYRMRVEAARLAVGDEAVAARRSAAALHGLIPSREIEILTTAQRRTRPSGFSVIRTSYLPDDHVVLLHGIPATSVPRTILDLGAVLRPGDVKRIAKDAMVRGLTAPGVLQEVLRDSCRPGRPGSAVARELIREIQSTDGPSESELEDEMFRLILEAGLEEPVRQFRIYLDGIPIKRADGAYPRLLIALEADGYEWHSAKAEWLRDRRQQNLLTAMGWVVLRFTWEDAARPATFVACLRETLEARARLLGGEVAL
jgi:very-short-patch-repair endonuclease